MDEGGRRRTVKATLMHVNSKIAKFGRLFFLVQVLLFLTHNNVNTKMKAILTH
jgi:hypothetical protein